MILFLILGKIFNFILFSLINLLKLFTNLVIKEESNIDFLNFWFNFLHSQEEDIISWLDFYMDLYGYDLPFYVEIKNFK